MNVVRDIDRKIIKLVDRQMNKITKRQLYKSRQLARQIEIPKTIDR